jgi:polyisoprenoid-binding protein YceI
MIEEADMFKRVVLAGMAVVALLAAVVAYAYLKPTAEASAPIEAIPIQAQATATAAPALAAETEPTTENEAAPSPSPTTEENAPAATATTEEAAPTEAAPAEASPTVEAAPAEASAPIIFEIEQESSQARYVIDEVLRGNPVTVVGSTNQVAGQIAVNPADPGATQLGTIQINARTFATDEDRRDTAVRNRILLTDQYEYITFTPTSLVGLPESASAGQPYSFQVVGGLTIRDQTREVTWDVTVTPVSESRLEGSAMTTIAYADWALSIPQVPFVAGVSEQVRLELDFVATAP